MRVWPRSHHNSWQLYGHSHGKLLPIGKQWDIGVDNNDFYPERPVVGDMGVASQVLSILV
jgi:calcineurin-like phosphoesterase family protein